MNVVLCESAGKKEFTAGNKARTDTVNILTNNGYKYIRLYRSKSLKFTIIIQMIFGCIKAILQAKKDDTVLIQYPYYPFVINKILLNILAYVRHIKKYRIGLLIHDSFGLRNFDSAKNNKDTVLKEEVQLFDKANYVICHNEKMIDAFRKAGGKGNYRDLGPFDYLYNGPMCFQSSYREPEIIVAGNLSKEKCGYLYQLSDAIKKAKFNLYGIGFEGTPQERVKYYGSFSPEELIKHLNGHYGLVWDGESCETCTGTYGEYLKFNNPHKFSLYLAAGIPLIVWSQSALADYVKANHIGVCVDSLYDLDSILNKVTKEQYLQMKAKVIQIRKAIICGDHLKNAIKE